MKLFRTLLCAALVVCSFGLGTALAQEVVVVNATGFTIQQLGLVDSNSNGSVKDLLGNDTLASGEGLRINISGSSRGWELIAVDDGGDQANWENLDLTGVRKITLRANGTANLE